MIPTFYRVITPSCEWGVIYFVSNISDIKVWEGKEFMSNGLPAMAEVMGYPFEEREFTGRKEMGAGDAPDTFAAIKGIKKLHAKTS
jgi:hypothetical protein